MIYEGVTTDREADDLLTHWGRWAVQGAGVPGCSAPGEPPVTIITDDEALLIDRLVARLGHRYPECGRVIRRYYTSDLTIAQLAKKIEMSKESTRQMWKAGVAWVDGALESRRSVP